MRSTPPRPELRHAQQADLAVTILQNAEQFSSASVGYAGMTPNEVIAWRVIAFRADAESTFLKLLDTATPAGQLYALAGLRFRSNALFTREAEQFKSRSDKVHIISGCIVWSTPFDEIVTQIGRGEWVRSFVKGSD
ncbi:MAG TPA: hypothetical protein VEM60_04750 [Candidatus Dormibacteraeota bacterium]|nr:hypothetical protein [Candidatus Dormibacteraeota bacterium]